RTINDDEKLIGADGYKQQINLVVAEQANESRANLLKLIRKRRGLDENAEVPLIHFVKEVIQFDRWMQDFGEFAAVRGSKDPSRRSYGIFDADRQRGDINVTEIGRLLGLSVTRLEGSNPDWDNGGNFGGNTEATADGTLYIGDRAVPGFIDGLRKLG